MPKILKSSKSAKITRGLLVLENGQIFVGKGVGARKYAIGELCFNTSQTGYQEILTDPSYAKQIITFTFPHIGIVGSNSLDLESAKIHASGCIINQDLGITSNWRSQKELDFFLRKNNIVCVSGIDTRQITRSLAINGALKAAVINLEKNKIDIKKIKKEIKQWKGLNNLELANVVTTNKKYAFNQGLWKSKKNKYDLLNNKKKYNIVCLDFGIKRNILRLLNSYNYNTIILPAFSSFSKIMSFKPDGIFLSNGPGDPKATGRLASQTIKKLINLKIPIFGICLGHQILCLSLGLKTKKMFQGHRGSNHPVQNIQTKKVEITSQNHGFEVDRSSFPKNILETHISLFDNTNEGISHKYLPVFSVQYHPEASPGPHDSQYLFTKFYRYVKNYAKK